MPMTAEHPIHERLGIETGFSHRDDLEPLIGIHRELKQLREVDRKGNGPELHRALMMMIADYCGLKNDTLGDVEKEYAHLAESISHAGKALGAYLRDVLVGDLLQRVSPTSEVLSVNDPVTLADILLTSRDSRTRFEARSALHFGILFWEYDKLFGGEAERNQRINEITLFLNAILFSSERMLDAAAHHHVSTDEAGALIATDIRIPQLDGSPRKRKDDEENIAMLSMREISPLQKGRGRERLHALFAARPKDPLSAALKSIRKNEPLRALKDAYGVTLSLYKKNESVVSDITAILADRFDIDPNDREHHPTCTLHPRDEEEQRNPHRSARFQPEKFYVQWNSQKLINFYELVKPHVKDFLSLRHSQLEFWHTVKRNAARTINVEFQINTLDDYLNIRLIGGDENHRVYKRRQASDAGPEIGARSILERIRPYSIYGVPWHQRHIREALAKKALAEIGIYGAALKLFGEEEV